MTFLIAVLLSFSVSTRPESEYLKSKFSEKVGNINISEQYKDFVTRETKENLACQQINEPQYVLFVDRNPNVQLATLLFVNPIKNEIIFVGSDKVSTGNPNRAGHFATPLGLRKNSPEYFSYRALGTKNSKGWRGFGIKGSRVWDFGWQNTQTKKGLPYQVRMLMHASDPGLGEARLGSVQSKGCIRISAKLNCFLDHFGILDAEYESNKKATWILRKDREPVAFAGRFVLVVDSSINSNF